MNTALNLSAMLAIACLMHGPIARATDDGDLARAQSTLRAALSHAYPQVVDWRITPRLASVGPPDATERTTDEVVIAHLGSRSSVRLETRRANGRAVRTLWFDVRGDAAVVVATRAVRADAALDEQDGALELRDVLSCSCEPLVSTEALRAQRARHSLRVHAVVCRDAIEPKPPVARGETVRVRYSSDRIELVGSAIALEDAKLGQPVRVVSSSSKEPFAAIASGAAEVSVHE